MKINSLLSQVIRITTHTYVLSLCLAEWQIMCVFKALHKNPQQQQQHSELSLTEFYNFYEVQNFKWREVWNLVPLFTCSQDFFAFTGN